MKTIHFNLIRDEIARLFQKANIDLSDDMKAALKTSVDRESRPLAKQTLLCILDNAETAKRENMPMCQDTGLAVVFAMVGQEIHFEGGALTDAINEGVRLGCQLGYLRPSVTADPINRGNSGDNTPAMVHVELVEGNQLVLRLLAKGGGCENMSQFKMLTPADGVKGVIDFVVNTAVSAGPNACPPMVIGVGLGGSFEYSAVLSKKALLRPIGKSNPQSHISELEQVILQKINDSGLGPQGYGGDTTSLAVHIETAACHIASLPVSVNIECHAHRHKEIIL